MRKDIKNLRIGSLEFGPSTYLCKPPKNPSWEIKFWYPNSYYGRKNEFTYAGDGMYRDSRSEYSYLRVHESCFKHPESCYTLGSFEWDEHEGFYEFHFCADRPMDLSEENWEPFRKLLIYGNEMLNQYDEEDGDD